MRWKILILFGLLFTTCIYGQQILIDFESDIDILIDDSMNVNWEIGMPQKEILTEAYSGLNSIITKTNTSYVSSDTSVFIVESKHYSECLHGLNFSYWTKFSTDSLTDFGYVEYSINGGEEWLFINDTTLNISENDDSQLDVEFVRWYSPQSGHTYSIRDIKPLYTGESNYWFNDNIYFTYNGSCSRGFDSIMFRFTFISDSVTNNNENGWIIDDIFIDWINNYDNVENQISNNLEIFPNPFSEWISINSQANKIAEIRIYNLYGNLIYQEKNNNFSNSIVIKDLNYPKGFYIIEIKDQQGKSYIESITKD